MIINWYTVVFQMLNFIVLVLLLRRFLYRPIIRAMDEREETISRRQEEAAAKLAEAEKAAGSYRQKESALRDQENEILEKARASAGDERKKLVEEARRDVEATRSRWEQEFNRERETFAQELRREMGRQACLIARRSLRDLAGTCLEGMVWSVFTEKFQHLKPEDEEKLRTALSHGDGQVTVRSAFDIPKEQLEQLRDSLAERFTPELRINYEPAPDFLCGLELNAGGYRLSWNMDSYLEGVEKRILKDIEKPDREETSNG